jgi:NO-binding membrane sensor protein with MHYT domain
MAKISIKGVLVGGITDVGTTLILGMPFAVYVGLRVAASHIPSEQTQSSVQAIMHRPEIFLPQLLIGCACSVLGGYVAARIAGHDEALNGCLSSFLCFGLGICLLAAHASSEPVWEQILMMIESPVLGVLGGYLCLKQRRRAMQPA